MNRSRTSRLSLLGRMLALPFGLMLIVLLIVGTISGLCWDYMFDMWLPYFGKENRVPFVISMLIVFIPVVGALTIPGWLITLITFSFIL